MSDYYVGQIIWSAMPVSVIEDTLPCDGRTLPVNEYVALFRVLGNTFGGDSSKFALPDLRGRTPMGQGPSPDSKDHYLVGDKGGAEAVTLTSDQVPAHNHVLQGTSASGIGGYHGNLIASTTGGPNPPKVFAPAGGKQDIFLKIGNIGNTGGGGAHNNMQPFLTLSAFIVTRGENPPGLDDFDQSEEG